MKEKQNNKNNKTPPQLREDSIVKVDIAEHQSAKYCEYMTLVVLSRALPDVRDGLKPVHRRILYALHQSYPPSGPYRKSARIVGDIIGKYHPHGDTSVYEAMVKMAQPWNMGATLVDGQGNFGSPDGDSPAAMRYTEAKMDKIGLLITKDLDNLNPNRQDMIPNYSEDEVEPAIMPSAFPNILVNGSSGIAVGMACEAPPYNLREVCLGAIALIKNPNINFDELLNIIPAPDFPTGCIIAADFGIREALTTGRGRIIMEGKAEIVNERNEHYIIVTSLPYNVKKSKWLESIGNLVTEQKIIGISNIKDRSSRGLVNVKIFLKNNANPEIILNSLYKFTALRSSFSVNSNFLVNNEPHVLNIKETLEAWISFRIETIYDRTEYKASKLRDSLKRQLALWIARYDIDNVISTIKSSSDKKEAVQKISQFKFKLSDNKALRDLLLMLNPDDELAEDYIVGEETASVIVEQKLSVLSSSELNKVISVIAETKSEIEYCEDVLAHNEKIRNIIVEELEDIIKRFGKDRQSEIVVGAGGSVTTADLIKDKDIIITLTEQGYIKATDISLQKDQRRGGQGKSAIAVRDNDSVIKSFFCSNKDDLMFFTKKGFVYTLPAWHIDESQLNTKGRFVANYLANMDSDDLITNLVVKPKDSDNLSIIFVTSDGNVKRNKMESFDTINSNGKIAMKLSDNYIVSVFLARDDLDDIFIYSSDGFAVRFQVNDEVIRTILGRNSVGVKGIRLSKGQYVLGALALPHFDFTASERELFNNGNLSEERMNEFKNSSVQIMTITDNGLGKHFSSNEINVTSRGNKGVAISKNPKDKLLLCNIVNETDSISIVTEDGTTIRIPASSVRETKSRVAKGVKLMNKEDGVKLISCTIIPKNLNEDINEDNDNN